MHTLLSCFDCFPTTRSSSSFSSSFEEEKKPLYEVQHVYRPTPTPTPYFHSTTQTDEATANATSAILSALLQAEKPGRNLDLTVQDLVAQAGGWYERLAVSVLNALLKVIKDGSNALRGAMKEAYDRASEAAKRIGWWAHDHPLYATAMGVVIALGVLVILGPGIIHALGFGVLGPEAGRFSFPRSFFHCPLSCFFILVLIFSFFLDQKSKSF